MFTNPKEIKNLRAGLKLTQAKLARLAGVRCEAVIRWEEGKTKPSLTEEASLRRLSADLDRNVGALVEFLRDKTNNPECLRRICGALIENTCLECTGWRDTADVAACTNRECAIYPARVYQ